MNRIKQYLPKGPVELGFTTIGATTVALILLKGLLKKRQNLRGKVVLITGASSGIGEALSHQFAKAGCKLVLAARSIKKLQSLKEELVELYKIDESSITPFYLDLEDHPSINESVKDLLNLYGRIDILINNAGIGCRAKVGDMELATYKKVMDINFFGQVELTKAVLPSMVNNGGGSIVAVSSLQGLFALPGGSAYGASKHALQAFCDSLRAENSKHNIHVLVVSPSYVKTSIAHSTLRGEGTQMKAGRPEIEKGMSSEHCANQILQSIRCYDTDLLIGPFIHKLVVYIRALNPALYNFIMSRL